MQSCLEQTGRFDNITAFQQTTALESLGNSWKLQWSHASNDAKQTEYPMHLLIIASIGIEMLKWLIFEVSFIVKETLHSRHHIWCLQNSQKALCHRSVAVTFYYTFCMVNPKGMALQLLQLTYFYTWSPELQDSYGDHVIISTICAPPLPHPLESMSNCCKPIEACHTIRPFQLSDES